MVLEVFILVLVAKLFTTIFCRFASRFIAWILSRVLGASVQFRVAGWVFVRDIVVKFKKVSSFAFVACSIILTLVEMLW